LKGRSPEFGVLVRL